MKILIVSQYYWPENFRINDIAETLVRCGNNVTVLTGLPNYPSGYILNDYKRSRNRSQIHNGVKIIRVKEIGRRNNILFRFLNYYSFSHFAKKKIKKLDKDFDIVLANELSPIMSVEPAILYKKINGTKIVMYEMDLWPESLLAGGIKQTSFIYRYYKKFSSRIYSSFDKILVSTNEHKKYILSLPNCSKLNIEYLPQYAESIFLNRGCKVSDVGNKILFTFAGNIGKAQNIDSIIDLAYHLKSDSTIEFLIVGNGSEYKRLCNKVKSNGLKNINFIGRLPLSQMPAIYNKSTIMIVSLENAPYSRMTIPGKVQTYIASGKPILSIAPGATNEFVKNNNIGLALDCINFANSQLVAEVFKNQNNLIKFQNASKQIYSKLFSKEMFMKKLCSVLQINSRNKGL